MNCFYILAFFSLLQLILIIYLLSVLYFHKFESNEIGKKDSLQFSRKSCIATEKIVYRNITQQCPEKTLAVAPSLSPSKPKGVAVTLMLHTPLWYQRRYTMMIQNTAENIPDDWVIQIFYTGAGQSLAGLRVNPGIQKYIDKKRVILTVIPEKVLSKKKKRFELMTEIWIWENMLADKVLVFGGGSVICSNSPQSIKDYLYFDYIGPPWFPFKGFAGDGSFSIRNRQLMVDIINYEMEKYKDKPIEKQEKAYTTFGQEDMFFISRLKEMLQKGLLYNTNIMTGDQLNHKKFKNIKNIDEIPVRKVFIANKNDSMKFAAMDHYYNHEVFAVSGTLPSLDFKDRDKFIQYCPEVKMFYPSLHDPHCFGATPESDKCAASICALKPKTERRGGC